MFVQTAAVGRARLTAAQRGQDTIGPEFTARLAAARRERVMKERRLFCFGCSWLRALGLPVLTALGFIRLFLQDLVLMAFQRRSFPAWFT